MKLRLSVLAAVCAATLPAFAAAHSDWSYTGDSSPEHWGGIKQDYAACSSGKNQSPVDFASAQAAAGNSVKFAYAPSAYTVENNGHTIQATPEGQPQTISLGGKTFTFKQFHFHTPSEHTFRGNAYPMEVHFVHQSDTGELAVLGAVFTKGRENPALKLLLAKKLQSGEKTALSGKLDVMPLFPKDRRHFRLNGSLTTPPCSEGVNWVVFKTPVAASEAQLDAMRAMIGQENNRPVQPLNARIVIEE